MSSLLSLPQWRGPVRQKSSTPFFPGAWPGTPSAAHSLEGGTSGPDDIEALKQIDERQTVDPSLPHLDHVTDFHRRISQSFIGPATRRSSGPKGINVEIPQSPHLTGLSEYTDLSSTSPTESLPTPEQYRPPDFTFPRSGTMLTRSSEEPLDAKRIKRPTRPMRNASRASSAASRRRPDFSVSAVTDSPLLQFARRNQENHAFSSPSPDTSYATSPEQPSSADNSSFAEQSSPTQSQLSDMPQPFPLSSFASTFFPLADKDSSHGLLSPSTLNSTRAIDSDSPVLGIDDASPNITAASLYAGQHRLRNPLNPSSAELDAFGIAASNIMIEAHSTVDSIPTSFQSTSALGSIDDTAQGHACRQSSVSLSLSLELSSSEHDSIHRAERFQQVCTSYPPKQARRRSRTPSPIRSFLQRANTPRTTSKVVAPHARPNDAGVKPGRFLTLDKVKKLGGRIRKLFKGKTSTGGNAENEIGVRTHTAVTAVEFTSEHPIPKIDTKGHGSVLNSPRSITQSVMSRTSILDPRKRRRQTMPASTSSVPNISQPRPLRPVSFLAMGSSGGSAPRHLQGMPNAIIFESQQPTSTTRRRFSFTEPVRSARLNIKAPPQVIVPAHLDSPAGRSRTHTAPQTTRETLEAKDRRFSLTAALGEALRTTVIPHPPLPEYALPPKSYSDHHRRQQSHTRSASTSANDAWNAGKSIGREPIPKPKENEQMVGKPDVRNPEDISPAMSPVIEPGLPLCGHSEIQVVDRHFPSDVSTQNRARSHTQSTVQDPKRARRPSRVQDESQNQPPTKRRSRGFSLSSAISKRALRARSIIAGRGDGSPAIPGPVRPEVRTSTTTTSVSGVSFDMITPGDVLHGPVLTISPPTSYNRDTESASGCAEYEPDLVLDRMSFATTELQSTPVSSMDLSFSPQSQAVNIPVHPLGSSSSASTSSSSFAEQADAIDSDEREEEREFMRTLGLEFDEIARRARDQSEGH